MSLSLLETRSAKQQLGEFDPNILCGPCDNIIGALDDYGIEFCRAFEKKYQELNHDLFQVTDFDGDKFGKFILAILWRASISRRKAFQAVSFGFYENRAREIIFGQENLSSLPAFQVMLQRYRSSQLDVEGIYSFPIRHKVDNRNIYSFMLTGFRVVAKLDAQPFKSEFEPLVLKGGRPLLGIFLDLEQTPEFEGLKEIAVRALKRGDK